jgi:hypothetical protein
MRKNLIIVRAGPNSLHQSWLDGDKSRTWDLLVCPYVEVSFSKAPGVKISKVIPGLKYAGLRNLLTTDKIWASYDYIILADDDLRVPPGTWTRFFANVTKNKAALAAPALTIGSVASHPVTVQQSPIGARRTTFVEVMMPCFRVDVLEKLLPTFDDSPSGIGWGLDYVWGKLLDYKDIFVVDETPISHSTPSHNDPRVVQLGFAEMKAMMKKYNAPQLEKNI